MGRAIDVALPIISEARNMLQGKIGNTLDFTAGAAILGSLLDWVEPAAAFLGLLYLSIRVYETDTVQNLLKKLGRYSKEKE